MADSTILISDLTEITTIDDSAYMVVDNGTATNKITVTNFNATATESAEAYAEAAAASAEDASDYADNCATIQTNIQGYVSTAEDAASNASSYATNAASSASSASSYASTASTAATNAASYASSASSSASTASTNATLAESWAIGGTGARSDESTNNSKYFASVASTNATNASTSATNAATSESNAASSESDAETHALVSEGYAVGTQDGTAVSSGTYYQNNAKYYAENAATSAEAAEAWSAHPPYIGTNGNWYVYDTTQSAFVDTEVEATGPQGETGNGVSSVAKTSTSGLVDTYTMTFTDGTTTTFTVTNGENGTGSGDMMQSNYDPDLDVYNVGGIPTYVSNQIGALDYSDSAVSGSYVTAVSETDGVVAVTREAADTTPTASSAKMVTSDGIKTYVDGKIEALDVTDTAVAGSYVTAVSETDGVVAVTREAADTTPTSASTAMVTSGGVYTALSGKQDTLSFDSAPTSGSSNPVTSGGVYSNTVSAVSGATGTSEGQVKVSVTAAGTTTATDMTVNGWDSLVGVWTSTVTAASGATTASFTNPFSTTSIAFDPYCENSSGTPYGVTAYTVTSSTITITFDELEEDTDWKLLVKDLS